MNRKILIVGTGKGSWAVRGLQLGAALGARVTSQPSDEDFAWADVVVLVKRAGAKFADQAQRAGRPIVWDALDFWSQPEQNKLTQRRALALLRARIEKIKPALIIGATQAMADACEGVYLPHHAWDGLSPTEASQVVSVVGYQGKKSYLGRWAHILETECRRRGWMFVINPPDLRSVDILVSFRDGPWDGWMCREWKSGVKIVNAIAAGRPIISQPCAAMNELQPAGFGVPGASVAKTGTELARAFDYWTEYGPRDAASNPPYTYPPFHVEAIATQYREMLERVA